MNKRGQRRNVKAEEEVVAAIWGFAKDNGEKEHNCTSNTYHDVSVNLEAVRTAKKRILSAFGYIETDIQ